MNLQRVLSSQKLRLSQRVRPARKRVAISMKRHAQVRFSLRGASQKITFSQCLMFCIRPFCERLAFLLRGASQRITLSRDILFLQNAKACFHKWISFRKACRFRNMLEDGEVCTMDHCQSRRAAL